MGICPELLLAAANWPPLDGAPGGLEPRDFAFDGKNQTFEFDLEGGIPEASLPGDPRPEGRGRGV